MFSDGRPNLLAIAKSILDSAGVRFVVRGEGIQDLFGWGRFPVGFNAFLGPVQILVDAADAADARALLVGLVTDEEVSQPQEFAHRTDESGSLGLLWRNAKLLAKVAAVVILIVFALEVAFGIVAQFV